MLSFANIGEQLLPLWIILGVTGFFGLLIIIIIVVKKHIPALQIKKEEINEEQAIQEELDRILVKSDEEFVEKKEESEVQETTVDDKKD